MIRETLANVILGFARGFGRLLGLRLAVVQSPHSLTIEMEKPDNSSRAWDTDLFKHGNLFLKGYANPIKNTVNQQPDLEDPNTVDVKEGETDNEETDTQPQVITSGRYREFMRQDLISQLLTPESRWNILVWAVLGLGILQFVAILITMWATGSFA